MNDSERLEHDMISHWLRGEMAEMSRSNQCFKHHQKHRGLLHREYVAVLFLTDDVSSPEQLELTGRQTQKQHKESNQTPSANFCQNEI